MSPHVLHFGIARCDTFLFHRGMALRLVFWCALLLFLLGSVSCDRAPKRTPKTKRRKGEPELDLSDLFGGGGGRKRAKKDKKACPSGHVRVPAKKAPELYANGCGPQGMQVKEPWGLFKCCNRHDICYSLCGTTFDFCESEFKGCMKEVCQAHGEKRAECQEQADGFSGMTALFGKGFHSTGQEKACDCVPEKQKDERHEAEVERLKQHGVPEEEGLKLGEFKGKEGELYYNLMVQYGKSAIEFRDIPDEL